jgi:multiple sugar transport system permease protein
MRKALLRNYSCDMDIGIEIPLKTAKRSKRKSSLRKRLLPYLFVSPYLIFVSVFVAFPVLFCLFLTFHKWNIISPMSFIGTDNYSRLIHDRLFWKAIGNTLKFLLLHIPLQLMVSLFLAYLLNQKLRAASFFRSSFFMPVIVSGVVVTILWQQLLGYDSGLINRVLMHMGGRKIGWLVDPGMAIYSIAVMATWKNLGLYVILFLVGLQTVPPQYYEAAKMEGANRWQQFYHITLPMINPTIFMVVILSTIGGFSLFIEPYIMTGGGPLNTTLSAVLYIYKQAFQYYNMGYSATLGFFYALMIMTVVILQKKFIEKEV